MTSYQITYFGKQEQTIAQRAVNCRDYWEACELGWKHILRQRIEAKTV